MHLTKVDFPAPDNPIIQKISPSAIVRLMSSSATISPAVVLKVLPRCLISIIRTVFLSLYKKNREACYGAPGLNFFKNKLVFTLTG